MYRGGSICLTVHFKPLWAKNRSVTVPMHGQIVFYSESWKQKHLAIAFADSVLGMTGMLSLCWWLQSTLWSSACAVSWACPLACSRDTVYGGEQRHRLKDLAKAPFPCNLENAIAERR